MSAWSSGASRSSVVASRWSLYCKIQYPGALRASTAAVGSVVRQFVQLSTFKVFGIFFVVSVVRCLLVVFWGSIEVFFRFREVGPKMAPRRAKMAPRLGQKEIKTNWKILIYYFPVHLESKMAPRWSKEAPMFATCHGG